MFTNLPYDAGSQPDPQIELMRITVNFEFEQVGCGVIAAHCLRTRPIYLLDRLITVVR
jgi:hypothetical protein